MDLVNLPFFYSLGHELHKIAEMTTNESNPTQLFIDGIIVKHSLNVLLNSYPDLSVCRKSIQQLSDTFDNYYDWYKENGMPPLDESKKSELRVKQDTIRKTSANCETVLLAELQLLTTYHPAQKGAYSTQILINEAEKTLPNSILEKLNEKTTADIRQAGKCLALDIPTACGFHIMRAIESVLHDYYCEVCEPESKTRLSNWGAYLTELRKVQNDGQVKEVIAILQQFKDRHRNLIMHPELILTDDDAHTLFEKSKAAIIAMAERLPTPKAPMPVGQ